MFERSPVLPSALLVVFSVSTVGPAFAQEPPAPPAPPASAAPPPAPPPPAPPAPPPAPPASGAPLPGATMAPPAPPPPPPPAASPWPTVTFQPDRPGARLERWEIGSNSGWQTVCEGGCTKAMDPRFGYRVAGENVVTSSWFKIPRSGEPLSLKADTGSRGVRIAGYSMAIAGPILGLVGAGIMAPKRSDDGAVSTSKSWDDRAYVGGGLAIGGAAMLLVGLALIGASGTVMSVDRASPPPTAKKKTFEFSYNGVQF